MTRITGIDPGTTHSGVAVLSDTGHVLQAGVLPNEQVLQWLGEAAPDMDMHLAIEWISSYGMAVGKEVFETCRWVGRFQQAWFAPEAVTLITRVDVKLALCNSRKAKDPNIRQALIDLFQPTGGGTCRQIGTSKQRGPLYGVHSHAWSALAVAVVASGRAAKANREMVSAFMGETPLERIAC